MALAALSTASNDSRACFLPNPHHPSRPVACPLGFRLSPLPSRPPLITPTLHPHSSNPLIFTPMSLLNSDCVTPSPPCPPFTTTLHCLPPPPTPSFLLTLFHLTVMLHATSTRCMHGHGTEDSAALCQTENSASMPIGVTTGACVFKSNTRSHTCIP